ncbi:hypothetical protein BOC58_04650 [Burkholderia pseudomallei]|nr:hypothetical protein BOC58_04650 [Burkholderia pseudomallei]
MHAADAAAVATFRLSAGSASRVRRVPAVPARRFGEAAGPRAPPKRRGAPQTVRTSSAPFNLTQPDVYFDPAILG